MKKRWLSILCVMLALFTLSSCASCGGNNSGTTATTVQPKNPYFYLWIRGMSPDNQYVQLGIKANAEPDKIVELKLSDFTMVGEDGTVYDAIGFLSSYSQSTDDAGNVTYSYEFRSDNTFTYNDSEKTLVPIFFPAAAKGGTLYHKGAKVLDRSAEYDEQQSNLTSEPLDKDLIDPEVID